MNKTIRLIGILVIAVSAGCASEAALFCESHQDCIDKFPDTMPYCDLTGEYDPGGHANSCVALPWDSGTPVADAQAADANSTPDASPPVVPLVGRLSARGEHTCALRNGAVRCWGAGGFGQLGNLSTEFIGDNESAAAATDVVVGGTVEQIAVSVFHSCALLDTRAVVCWGSNLQGAHGYPNTDQVGDNETPASNGEVALPDSIELGVGGLHSCAITNGGKQYCWGAGSFGRLGYGDTENVGDNEDPQSAGFVDLGAGTPTQVAAGGGHTCVLLDQSNVRCWGRNGDGELGYGHTNNLGDDEAIPQIDVDVGGPVVQISAGTEHTCALLDSGGVRCWGNGQDGRLGYGNVASVGDNESPRSVGDISLGGRAVQVSAGTLHTCALMEYGDVRCWGLGTNGRLGHESISSIGDTELPSSIEPVDLGGRAVAVEASGAYTCALMESGAIRCWGKARYLGYGGTDDIGDNEAPASAGDVPVW